MATSTAQAELVERLRSLLKSESSTREVPMFGGRSFMVDEKLVVSALKAGDLLVRIPPTRHAELTGRAGVRQAEMGTGRSMGPGWVHVDADVITTEESLADWVAIALERNRSADDL